MLQTLSLWCDLVRRPDPLAWKSASAYGRTLTQPGIRNVPCGVSRSRFSCDRYAESPAADLFPHGPCRELPKSRLPRRYADFSGILHCSSERPPAGGRGRSSYFDWYRSPVRTSFVRNSRGLMLPIIWRASLTRHSRNCRCSSINRSSTSLKKRWTSIAFPQLSTISARCWLSLIAWAILRWSSRRS